MPVFLPQWTFFLLELAMLSCTPIFHMVCPSDSLFSLPCTIAISYSFRSQHFYPSPPVKCSFFTISEYLSLWHDIHDTFNVRCIFRWLCGYFLSLPTECELAIAREGLLTFVPRAFATSFDTNWNINKYFKWMNTGILVDMPMNLHVLGVILQMIGLLSLFVAVQLCPTLCSPMDCSIPVFPVFHHLLELTQTHVHWVADAIQASHPLSSPSPPAFHPSQCQGLFQWVGSLCQVVKVMLHWSEMLHFSISPFNEHSRLISFRTDWFDLIAVQGTLKWMWKWKSLNHVGLYTPWNSPGQNIGVGSLSLLQGIFMTQGLDPGLSHCGINSLVLILFYGQTLTSYWTTGLTWLLEKPSLWLEGLLLVKEYLCFLIRCLGMSLLFFQGASVF